MGIAHFKSQNRAVIAHTQSCVEHPASKHVNKARYMIARIFSGKVTRTVARTAMFIAVAAAVVSVTGCATQGPSSTQARPIIYPNAVFNRLGEGQARTEVDSCMARATQAVSAEAHNDSNRRAGQAAATAAVAAAVGSLVSGSGLKQSAQNAAGGAAVAGATVATAGAFEGGKANSTHRAFVQRCVSEKGLEIIGWN